MTGPEENAPQRGSQSLSEGDSSGFVFITADQFRLSAVIAHIRAGRIVIVVPADRDPPAPNPRGADPPGAPPEHP